MPDLASDYYDLGNRLAGQQRYDEAVAYYEKAVALRPGAAEVHSNLGVVFATQEQYEKACAHFRKALAARPSFVNAHFGLAKSLTALNRPVEAVKHYKKVVALQPNHTSARLSLGMLLNSLGYHDKAVSEFKKVVKSNPDNAAAHNNLGAALHALGRSADAISHFRAAIRLRWDLSVAHINLAKALAGLRRDEEALAHYDTALILEPRSAEALCRRADALYRLERIDEAVAAYEKTLAVAPGLAEAHNNLGTALLALRRYDEAIARFERALALDEGCAQAHSNLATALQAVGRLQEARRHYDHALGRSPASAAAHVGKGGLLLELGRIGEARRAFERAIELEPGHTLAYHSLAETKRFSSGDPHLAAMERLAETLPGLRSSERIELHFALGKALADVGRYDESHNHFVAGNALKRSTLTYDEASTLEFLDHLKARFPRGAIEGLKGLGNPSAVPIFIVGMPRSGTTLVEQILASHSQVFAAGELRALTESMEAIQGFDAMLDGLDPDMDRAMLRELGDRYIDRITALAPDARHVSDKMPANFRFLGLIHLALPGARIVHVRRNPVDTCLSCFSKLFTYDQRFSYDLGELGRYYRAYDQLMRHWHAVLPGNVLLDVSYEDIVGDVEGQARRIVAHCRLQWEESCLEFHRAQRPVRTASAAQVRRPLYKTSIGRSQAYGEKLRPLLEALGPELAGRR